MSRTRSLAAMLLVIGATAGVGVGAGAGDAHVRATASAAHFPARMLVYAQEWSLWLSRPSLPAGAVTVQLWNRGEDAHDLRIRRLRDGHMTGATQGVSVTQSGDIGQATWRMAPGRYMLYCSMPGHYARGMHVELVVEPVRSARAADRH